MEKRLRIITPYLLVILITILVAGYGCSDSFFDQQAGDRITPDKHFKSIVDVSVSRDGAVIPLKDFLPKFILLDGLRSDQMDVVAGRADAYLTEINDQIFTSGNPYTDVSDLYKVIINVNEILANIDRVSLIDRNADSVYINYMNTGLLGLRSWAYFTIVRLYGEAAYIDGTLSSLPENLVQTKLSKDVMIDTLINQLTRSMAKNDETKFEEQIIFGYPSSKAVLGELYLEKGDYVNAAKYLKLACQILDDLPILLKVDKGYTKEAWKNIFVNSESGATENIAIIPFSSTNDQVNPLTQWMLYSDQYLVKPSQVVIDSFKTQIQLLGLVGDGYRGLGVSYDTAQNGDAYINKYSIDEGEPYSADIIVSRAADVHLLLAEALNRNGETNVALILLNDGFLTTKIPGYTKWINNLGIRGRAYLANRIVPVELTGDDLTKYVEDLIIAERSMELAFEGKRWFDLVRIAERRGDPEFLASKVAAKYSDPAKAAAVHDFLMNPANWYLK